MRPTSIILRTDSYKVGHWLANTPGLQTVYSYGESRGGEFSETVFFGLQYLLKEYLTTPITQGDIDRAEVVYKMHFGTDKMFNRKGWQHILDKHDGYLPLRIKAVPEGTVVPTRNVLFTIENTDIMVPWLTNWVETLLLKVWYSSNVATLSREIKKVIADYMTRTGADLAGLPFKLHDFGYRGVSSEESAGIGGLGHLVNFMGSDTVLALETALLYYSEGVNAAFSIFATEHSVMCQKGPEGEFDMMQHFLNVSKSLGPVPAVACVSDTYNIFDACKKGWGGRFKDQVENLGTMLVVRPDSGDPNIIPIQVIETLDEEFGHTVNAMGFKVLNNVRVIQGDGITLDSIKNILQGLFVRGWSAENIAFGMGGALLQMHNRDTQKYAIKASSYVINGERFDFQKNPITDSGKRSKAGRLKLVRQNGVLTTVKEEAPGEDVLVEAYLNGRLMKDYTFSEVRANAAI